MMLRHHSLHGQWRLVSVGLLILFMLLPASAPGAAAHPLGNFTINLYSRLEVGAESIHVAYVVDMAEIPTYQEFGSATPDTQARQDYLRRRAVELQAGLRLLVDGRTQELALAQQAMSFPPGRAVLSQPGSICSLRP